MEAAQLGNLESLENTYPEGCDADSVNRKDEDGRTPLVRDSLCIGHVTSFVLKLGLLAESRVNPSQANDVYLGNTSENVLFLTNSAIR